MPPKPALWPTVVLGTLSADLPTLMSEHLDHPRDVSCCQIAASPQPGAIAFVGRFGSPLNPHPHIRAVVPDVVFTRASDGSHRRLLANRIISVK